MHLIWENVMKNLVLLWKGEFKGLDTGQESYELGKNTIPSTYGASPPNVTTDRMACTADTWSFWTLYIGPVVLRHKFTKEKYYKHFIDLVKILHVCLQFELSADDIQTVCRWLERWVLSYEEMYYQHDPCRINTCPVTIHALLHVADSIEATGPVWTSWSFPIEHFCGQLQPVIRTTHIVHDAQLAQLEITYNLKNELSLQRQSDCETAGHFRHPASNCTTIDPTCALLPPCHSTLLEDSLKTRVAKALATRFNTTLSQAHQYLDHSKVELWGKVKQLDGGDTMVAATLAPHYQDLYDASYIWYEVLVDRFAWQWHKEPVFEKRTFFGQLRHIIVLHLSNSVEVDGSAPTIFLAAIQPCKVTGFNNLDMHFFSDLQKSTNMCVVGRVADSGGRLWAIIDRSGNLARASYNGE
ncbi:hypothetical protein BKA83DRAFT_4463948 [Pisolithus microcarpus]|nr:hypothetical protein BKA83DRAFT_4463948 [Pisolithus microcarpus]